MHRVPAYSPPPAKIDPHKTRFTTTLAVMATIGAGLICAGFYAGMEFAKVTARLASIEVSLASMVTKRDLQEFAKDDVPGLVIKGMRAIHVSCPTYVIRGATAVLCSTVIPPGAP